MAAMMNPDLGTKIEHVNERINRIMDVVSGMESKLENVSRALAQLQGSAPPVGLQNMPAPRQLPTLSGGNNPMMRDFAALLPLFQSLMQGSTPDAQTLLQGVSALINLKQNQSRQLAPQQSSPSIVHRQSVPMGSSFIIFLVLILILLGTRPTYY